MKRSKGIKRFKKPRSDKEVGEAGEDDDGGKKLRIE